MDLALNNLKRVDMPLNKETKPTKPILGLTEKDVWLYTEFKLGIQHLWLCDREN